MSEGVDAGITVKMPVKVAEKPVEVRKPISQGTAQDVLERQGGDNYRKLNLSEDATAAEVKSAYFSAMKLVHPDVNPDPKMAEVARELNEVYAVLSNPEKRSKYDQFDLQEAKAKAARAAAEFTSNEQLDPADAAEARKWADGIVGSLDSAQLEEIKRNSMEAAAMAQEKGLVKPEQVNFIMGNTITRNFLNLVPNENTQFLLKSAAEQNAEHPEALLLLLLMIMALLMEAAADLVSDNTDGFLEKVAMALAAGGMGAVYEYVEQKKKEKRVEEKKPVITVTKMEEAVSPTSTVGEQPARLEGQSAPQLPTGMETHAEQQTPQNMGALFFTAAVMVNMRQGASVGR